MGRIREVRAAVVLAALAACSSGENEAGTAMGTEGGTCRPDGSCDATLTCVSERCVDLDSVASGGSEVGGSGADVTRSGGSGGSTGGSAGTPPRPGGAGSGGTLPATGGSVGFGGILIGGGSGGQAGSLIGCQGTSVAAEPAPDPLDIYLMVDKSSSMAEPLGNASSKWDAVEAAVTAFVNSAGTAGTGVAIQFFGLPDSCNPDAYQTPVVPMGRLPAVAPDIANAIAAEGPATLTPTAPALQGALRYMESYAPSAPGRRLAVGLITDGFPTECGVQCASSTDCQSGSCVSGMCDPGTSISEIAALAERYATADPPIYTYFIGVAQGLANLTNIARGGGTGEARLIDGGDIETSVAAALLSIVQESCAFALPAPPEGESFDPSKVNLELSGSTIPGVVGVASCNQGDGQGWYYDSQVDPSAVYLCDTTCQLFTGQMPSFVLGCSTARR